LAKLPKIKEFSKPYRPVMVISNDVQNEFYKLVTVATMTTDDIDKIQFFEIYVENTLENGLDEPSKILLHCLFTIDKELRLIKHLGLEDKEIIEKIKLT
jgi:mRNA-degrading endonuclease toxin of MazEF toxin-antitoxin module